jgi:hypothetical protein
MVYEIWLTAICLITTALGMFIAWRKGYEKGEIAGYRRGRTVNF